VISANTIVQDRKFLSQTEAAAICGVCASTITFWSAVGYFPPRRFLGMRIVYPVSEVEEWLAGVKDRLEPCPLLPSPGYRKGEDHHRSKWPDEFVAQCIKLHSDGMGIDAIAVLLGMPKSTVYKYVTGAGRAASIKRKKEAKK
jgi:predicted DNA-binding transcriptional regulator AlpA